MCQPVKGGSIKGALTAAIIWLLWLGIENVLIVRFVPQDISKDTGEIVFSVALLVLVAGGFPAYYIWSVIDRVRPMFRYKQRLIQPPRPSKC